MDANKLLAIVCVSEMLMESSSSSEDSEEDDNKKIFALASVIRETHPRQTGYLSVIMEYSNSDFWRHFRVSQATFNYLLRFMEKNKFRSEITYYGGYEPLSNSEVLLITLQYLGNQGAIRLLADKFDRTESSIWNAIEWVCNFLFKHQSCFIKWPVETEMPYIASKFKDKCGFPGVVGAIDGCHIPFHPLFADQKSYRNYKKFHSFVIMAIVLYDGTFSYVFSEFPGSSHDSYIFHRSSLYNKLNNRCSSMFNPRRYHIIGDSAFPIQQWCLTPYKKGPNGITRSQRTFNFKLSATRMVVEHSFGELKNRFRRCQNVYAKIDKAVNVVVSSCVLHNICIQKGDINRESYCHIPLHCNVNPNHCDQR